ncbi:uncharacterized protein LOC106464838 [Limulus polyphemus]|uniref:Uncharacterized protein LOC106464838 n=1 Tax=Limulus polyphemus TaxID=6850 RepID=A0ABM1SXI8_LIMPO|nr:uncharacterized protein LOC106464838 [Limulus polyphemus]
MDCGPDIILNNDFGPYIILNRDSGPDVTLNIDSASDIILNKSCGLDVNEISFGNRSCDVGGTKSGQGFVWKCAIDFAGKANEEVDELFHLPSDVLAIKESSDASVAYAVFTKIPLTKEVLFGPFKGQVYRGKNLSPKTTIVEIRDSDGEKVYLDLNDEAGSWLRLVKPATTPQEANLTVFVEGNEIWCLVHCDTEKDVELCAWYRIMPHWNSSVTTHQDLFYPVVYHHSRKSCNYFVSRFKRQSLEENDEKKNVKDECQDPSINSLKSNKSFTFKVKGEVNSMKKENQWSSKVTVPLTDDTSSSGQRNSLSKERHLDITNSSGDENHFDGDLKLSKLSLMLNNSTPMSKLSFSVPNSLPITSTIQVSTENALSEVQYWKTGFLCEVCGITFNNSTTLQAHRQNYCFNRRSSSLQDVTSDNSSGEVVLSSEDEEIELKSSPECKNNSSENSERHLDAEYNDQESNSSNSCQGTFVKAENQNTIRKTRTDLQLVNAFLSKTGEQRPLEKIPPKELDYVLSSFIVNVKKRNGDDYEPDSLRGLLSSVDRYLRKQEYPDAIFGPTGVHFTQTRESLRMKQLQLKSQGKGCLSTKHVPLTDSEIDKLFLSRQLGASSKDSIINTLWFYNSIFFGIRSAKRHYELRWGDILLCQLPNGLEYLEYIDQETKKPKEGVMGNFHIYANLNCPDRDPIHIYRLYTSHRPECMKKADSPFYLVPNHSKATYNNSWFKRQPLGENRLASLMKSMAKNAGLSVEKHFYNISVRRALISKLQTAI